MYKLLFTNDYFGYQPAEPAESANLVAHSRETHPFSSRRRLDIAGEDQALSLAAGLAVSGWVCGAAGPWRSPSELFVPELDARRTLAVHAVSRELSSVIFCEKSRSFTSGLTAWGRSV